MQDEQQFQQLMMQYEQIKNGSYDIARMIENQNFDDAITMVKARESVFFQCKCMLKYLEPTPVQQKELDKILDEIRELELANMKKLEKGMAAVQAELSKSQKSQKIQNAYENSNNDSGSIINVQE